MVMLIQTFWVFFILISVMAKERIAKEHYNIAEDYEEDDPNYPEEEIRRLLEANPAQKDYFAVLAGTNIQNRNLDVDDGESLCRTIRNKIIHPKRMKNINNIWRIVININNQYEQGVELRKCYSDGPCDKMENLPFGYTSYCKQEFIIKELVIFNGTTGFDLFKFPSCCVCKIKKS